MKFVEVESFLVYQIITDDSVHYRTNSVGDNWERLYGSSWEPVYLDEEEHCIAAWQEYKKV